MTLRPHSLQLLAGPVRLNFLVLTPACVFLGLSAALVSGATVSVLDVVVALTGALMAHASVNLLNEYDDFHSGLDSLTLRTPFSGGSGTLPAHPEIAALTLAAGVMAFVIAAVTGLYFLVRTGFALLPLGLAGLLIVASYTRYITRSPILCLLAPGLGFGPLMVLGTSVALTGHYTVPAALVSLTPFFLVSDLLLINQFPDVEADRQIGRRHLPIAIGRRASAIVYGVFLILAYVPVALGVLLHILPTTAALGLAPVVVALPLAWRVVRCAEDRDRLIPLMGINVAVVLFTIVVLAAGLLLGS